MPSWKLFTLLSGFLCIFVIAFLLFLQIQSLQRCNAAALAIPRGEHGLTRSGQALPYFFFHHLPRELHGDSTSLLPSTSYNDSLYVNLSKSLYQFRLSGSPFSDSSFSISFSFTFLINVYLHTKTTFPVLLTTSTMSLFERTTRECSTRPPRLQPSPSLPNLR